MRNNSYHGMRPGYGGYKWRLIFPHLQMHALHGGAFNAHRSSDARNRAGANRAMLGATGALLGGMQAVQNGIGG
jgi:hypothetical protein